MSATTRKTGKRSPNSPLPASPTGQADPPGDVLTLAEAAVYLRASEEEILRLAKLTQLPGREIGGQWRFLKGALQDWLRTSSRKPPKEAFLALAGAWRDYPDVESIVQDAHRRRGRVEPERGE
ncbi:MAG: helix-turn-helix domain-containing protein [Gemmataceae bacterium]